MRSLHVPPNRCKLPEFKSHRQPTDAEHEYVLGTILGSNAADELVTSALSRARNTWNAAAEVQQLRLFISVACVA